MRFTLTTTAAGLIGLGLLTYVLGSPAWWLIIAAFVVVLLVGWAVARSLRSRRSVSLDVAGVAVAVAISAAAAAVGFSGPPAQPAQDTAARREIVAAASSAVIALMTFGPGQGMQQSVAARLAEPLLTDYRGSGPDVVLMGAVESGTRVSATVPAGAVERQSGDTARVLLYVDQEVTPPGQSTQHVQLAQWASLERSGSAWLLSDLRPVGVEN